MELAVAKAGRLCNDMRMVVETCLVEMTNHRRRTRESVLQVDRSLESFEKDEQSLADRVRLASVADDSQWYQVRCDEYRSACHLHRLVG